MNGVNAALAMMERLLTWISPSEPITGQQLGWFRPGEDGEDLSLKVTVNISMERKKLEEILKVVGTRRAALTV